MPASLRSLLARPRPLLLDGAVGTELARRGVPTTLPLWSARALFDATGRRTLAAIHSDYARAGAEVLVTNTFRTTERALRKAGRAAEWHEVNDLAVRAARAGAAAAPGACLVAGGLAPLEDCYSPDLVPPQAACVAEHTRQAALFAELGVDLIQIETMNTLREARAALDAARLTGLPILLSLCPAPPDRLLSGEPLAEAVAALAAAGGDDLRALLVNCATPETLAIVFPPFAAAVARMGLAAGVYAHLGEPDPVSGWRLPSRHEPERYAAWTAARLADGARLIGGCCGTTPEHIAALAALAD